MTPTSQNLLTFAFFALTALPKSYGCVEQLGHLPGWQREDGRGQINGAAFPVMSLRSSNAAAGSITELYQAIRHQCHNQRTVTLDRTDGPAVIMLADVASKDCPDCQKMLPANLPRIAESTVALAIFTLPNGGVTAVGIPLAPFLKASKALRQPYNGDLFRAVKAVLQPGVAVAFEFADLEVHAFSGTLNTNVLRGKNLLEEDLKTASLLPLESSTKESAFASGLEQTDNAYENIFANKQGATYYRLKKIDDKSANILVQQTMLKAAKGKSL